MRNGAYNLVVPATNYQGKRYRGRYSLEHHVVWLENTGQLVTKGYVVHHKNNDGRDNRFVNLELLLVADHNRLHNNQPPILLTCPVCKISFARKRKNTYLAKGGLRTFCSRPCAARFPRKKSQRELGKPVHGTKNSYSYWRCRCQVCKKANTESMRIYKKKKNTNQFCSGQPTGSSVNSSTLGCDPRSTCANQVSPDQSN